MASASLDDDDRRDDERSFLTGSYLSYIIPSASNFKPETALRPSASTRKGRFEGVQQRDLLFFGTQATRSHQMLQSQIAY